MAPLFGRTRKIESELVSVRGEIGKIRRDLDALTKVIKDAEMLEKSKTIADIRSRLSFLETEATPDSKRIEALRDGFQAALTKLESDIQRNRNDTASQLGSFRAEISEIRRHVESLKAEAPSKVSTFGRVLLIRMHRNGVMGGKHLGEANLLRGVHSHDVGELKAALKELVRKGLVVRYPHEGGKGQWSYNLNDERLKEIEEIIEE